MTATEILASYSKHCDDLEMWIKEGRLDFVQASLLALQKYLQPQQHYEEVRSSRTQWNHLGRFLQDLPGDLQQVAKEYFEERGYAIPRPRKKSRSK